MNSPPTRIMVVDDHPLLREGVCITLESDPSFTIVGQAESYDEALASVAQANPDIMLIDVSMPGGGINTAREIHQNYPDIKIIMLTVSEDEKDVSSALQAGARGYILKGIGGKDLINAVHRIAQGESFITPSLATSILLQAHTQTPDKGSGLLGTLSEREAVILKALERGLTNKQIADELELSEKTIKHYMTIILKKLGVKNRVEAALMAQKHEFLE
jgi:two-component system, NarL family, nitrate/nitrite response regulator NarL